MLRDEGGGPLAAVADLADDLSKSGSLLPPDQERRFQRRSFEASELHHYLVDEVSRRFAGKRPQVILCCGKCRVGSTPLSNVFGHAGLPALYQPMKTLLRYELVGETCPPWRDLTNDQPIIFLKETFGPYVLAECKFSPLKVLLDAGFRSEDITLVVMERDPLATLGSWRRCWDDRVSSKELLATFFLASFNAHKTAIMAADFGIQTEYYLHEGSKEPEVAISQLFDSLGLGNRFDVSILRNWTAGDSLRGANTAVTFFPQPKSYWIEDIHLELNEYRFVQRYADAAEASLKETDAAILDQLSKLYQQARKNAG